MSDDPYARAVLSVIRLIAVALLMASAFLYATDLFLYLSHKPISSTGSLVSKGIPFLAGVILLVKSRALAERFTEDLD